MTGKVIKLGNGQPFDKEKMLLVFTHIPKSGGTSFHAGLKEVLAGEYLHLVPGQNNPEVIDALCGIGGHFNFESPAVSHSTKDRVYTTLLRHPVDRFVSFYKHVLARPYHHLPQKNPKLLKMEPLEFAETLVDMGNPEIGNLQCRMICGGPNFSAEQAIERISKDYSFCMDLSMQQSALDQIADAFQAKRVEMKRLNVASKEHQHTLSKELVTFIHEVNAEDMSLYHAIHPK